MAPARIVEVPATATGFDARRRCRYNTWDAPTSGLAPGYLQANLIVLPSRYAHDFKVLCARNPVPCPLLATSSTPGEFDNLTSHMPGIEDDRIAAEIDIRTDAPRYNVYVDGKLQKQATTTLEPHWDTSDHVAFLIGCSYTFEKALTVAGLTPPHMLHGRNVPMYRTNIPLCPAGVFTGSTSVVSMRMYRSSEVGRVRDITRPYVTTHGEPLSWGWEGMTSIGINDINKVDWGDPPVTGHGFKIVQAEQEAEEDGLVPVFWGCGVTPQEAVMKARIPGVVMSHAPGYMVVLDVEEEEVIGKAL
ncbi:hypothetical protein LTR37_005009 [Vermiconidia calcicola]|uniref:Uncharacterized protein n=1 Tax=Vermiconidia calcicola TaxID=1690605 RepID=A0ACC3NLA1_9PEZI|nr:hypothetical protein LTR37_005009 [Vermiconidia calcicola]